MLAQRRLVTTLVVSLLGLGVRGAVARAQTPTASDKVTAEALFEEGRSLMQAGKVSDACPKLEASQRVGPSPATLLNLANCWEKAGRTATAWAVYKEAASAADAGGRQDYVATATRHSEALVGKLARLTIRVESPVEGIQVKRDGVVIERAEWGLGIPIDTGSHTVEAVAPCCSRWSSTVVVGQDGAQVAVSVPPLEVVAAPASATAPPPLAAPAVSPVAAPGGGPPPLERPAVGPQRVVALVVGGVGIVGLALGGGFALAAKSKYSDSLNRCRPDNPDLCQAAGVSERNDARGLGNLATVGTSVGAAALVAGAVLWFTAPAAPERSGSSRLVVSASLGGVSLRGAW